MWEEILEKAVNVKAKASLQPLLGTRKIDSRYLKGYRPSAKKEKNKANQKHRDENNNKAKSANFLFANISQLYTQIQAFKKNKRHENHQRGHPATRVNATKITKKNKDKNKAKDLTHIKCYICKQKGHYDNKYLKKMKN